MTIIYRYSLKAYKFFVRNHRMPSKIVFVLKQLLPLKYETNYTVTEYSGKNELLQFKVNVFKEIFKAFKHSFRIAENGGLFLFHNGLDIMLPQSLQI